MYVTCERERERERHEMVLISGWRKRASDEQTRMRGCCTGVESVRVCVLEREKELSRPHRVVMCWARPADIQRVPKVACTTEEEREKEGNASLSLSLLRQV